MAEKKQLNVRLTEEDLANVELLKSHDVSLAEVIRDALRQRAQGLHPRKTDLVSLVRELEQRHPDTASPAGSPYEGVDTTDRGAMSSFIQANLRGKSVSDEAGRSGPRKERRSARKAAAGKSKRKSR